MLSKNGILQFGAPPSCFPTSVQSPLFLKGDLGGLLEQAPSKIPPNPPLRKGGTRVPPDARSTSSALLLARALFLFELSRVCKPRAYGGEASAGMADGGRTAPGQEDGLAGQIRWERGRLESLGVIFGEKRERCRAESEKVLRTPEAFLNPVFRHASYTALYIHYPVSRNRSL